MTPYSVETIATGNIREIRGDRRNFMSGGVADFSANLMIKVPGNPLTATLITRISPIQVSSLSVYSLSGQKHLKH